jgi:hypothetical protein
LAFHLPPGHPDSSLPATTDGQRAAIEKRAHGYSRCCPSSLVRTARPPWAGTAVSVPAALQCDPRIDLLSAASAAQAQIVAGLVTPEDLAQRIQVRFGGAVQPVRERTHPWR